MRWTKPNLYSHCTVSTGEGQRELHCGSCGFGGPWRKEAPRVFMQPEMQRAKPSLPWLFAGICVGSSWTSASASALGIKLLTHRVHWILAEENWPGKTTESKTTRPQRGSGQPASHPSAALESSSHCMVTIPALLLLSSRGHRWIILPYFGGLPGIVSLLSRQQTPKMFLRRTLQFETSFLISWPSLLCMPKAC